MYREAADRLMRALFRGEDGYGNGSTDLQYDLLFWVVGVDLDLIAWADDLIESECLPNVDIVPALWQVVDREPALIVDLTLGLDPLAIDLDQQVLEVIGAGRFADYQPSNGPHPTWTMCGGAGQGDLFGGSLCRGNLIKIRYGGDHILCMLLQGCLAGVGGGDGRSALKWHPWGRV